MKVIIVLLALLLASCSTSNKIVPASNLPATTPWDLELLSSTPEYEWSTGDKVRSLYYKNLEYKGKATRVFAYYATPGTLKGDPSLDKNLPGIVLVHGGGGRAFDAWVKLWASRGYAAIAMDLGGCGPEKNKRIQDGGPAQGHPDKFQTIDKPINEHWTYHAVGNVIRAHSLLRSFPEVDESRTAITGISWGGYTTCIVSGLDNRFKASVPIYGYGFLSENSTWLNDFARMTPENAQKWVTLWDPKQYVTSASMPMLFVNSGQDFAYPPDSHAETYGLVQSEKNLRFTPNLPHGHIFDKPKAVQTFIDHHLKRTDGLHKTTDLKVTNLKVIVIVQAEPVIFKFTFLR